MGSRNLKTIKGKEYLYYVISENGKKRAMYCGLASKHESSKKAIQLEILELKKKKQQITKKIEELSIILK